MTYSAAGKGEFDWLKKLAWDVHELIESADGTAMAMFRSMVTKWNAMTNHDLTLPLSDPSVEPVSIHERSIVEQYAVLAAIHDRCCKGVVSINPWEKEKPHCLDAVPFTGLVHDIPALIHDGDERILNAFLRRVKDDLANIGSAVSEGNAFEQKPPQNPLDRLENPILCTLVAGIVGETPSNVAAKLKRRHYVVITEARKNHCEVKHAAAIWPHKKAALEKYLKNTDSEDE